VPAFILCFLTTIAWGASQGEFDVRAEAPGLITAVAVAIGSGLVTLRIGLAFVRGRRRTELFLRRFGHVEATEAVTFAASRVGRSWRLVTLDDDRIAPVGAGPASTAFAPDRRGAGCGRPEDQRSDERPSAAVVLSMIRDAIGEAEWSKHQTIGDTGDIIVARHMRYPLPAERAADPITKRMLRDHHRAQLRTALRHGRR
jgi:hypothetical protein